MMPFAWPNQSNMISGLKEKTAQVRKLFKEKTINYHKVASRRLPCLVAPFRIFRLFMKGKFDAHVL